MVSKLFVSSFPTRTELWKKVVNWMMLETEELVKWTSELCSANPIAPTLFPALMIF
jgi:hypothetical protein